MNGQIYCKMLDETINELGNQRGEDDELNLDENLLQLLLV